MKRASAALLVSLLAVGGVLTDPTLVLRATVDLIDAYLRNVFAGAPSRGIELPDFVRPARLGVVD